MSQENKIILTDEEKKEIVDRTRKETKSMRSKFNLLNTLMTAASQAMEGMEGIEEDTLAAKAKAEGEMAEKEKLVILQEKFCDWLVEEFAIVNETN